MKRDQDVVRLELRDGVGDGERDTAAAGQPASVGADGAHVPQHRVEARVGDVTGAIDIVGEPVEAVGERGREHVDLSGSIDRCAHRRRQFVHVGDGRIGDEEQAVDRRYAGRRVALWDRGVRVVHRSISGHALRRAGRSGGS